MTGEEPASSTVGRLWLVPMVGLVALAVAAVEVLYLRAPIPPGVDPGDWIQRSFAWVGLRAVTPDAVGSPYLYPPVMFPILGGLVRATGSPLTAGFVFGGFLLALFGLTCIHLARRFLRTGPGQLLFVGLAVLNGTTLQILFWGGYPNFLAFSLFNEAMVFLLAFVRTRRTVEGLAFWGLACVTYLTHSLTFVVLLATTAIAAGFLLLGDRSLRRLLTNRGNVVGVVLLAATVGIYNGLLRFFRIEAPSYFGSNPSAYSLNNIGGLFRPLQQAPLFLPAGPALGLSSTLVVALLIASALALALAVVALDRYWGLRDPRWSIAAAAMVAALLVPAVGWLAHVDTDYTRFVYFLPFPIALGLALLAEPLLSGFLRGELFPHEPAAEPAGQPRPAPAAARPPAPRGREAIAGGVVGLVLLLLAAGVSAPTMVTAEQSNTLQAHDPAFLDALHYLQSSRVGGNVLTLQASVRWTEAVTSRGAFDVGPTWLLFEPWQIVNAEESYWAFNSRYTLTNNLDALAFAGGYQGADTGPLSFAPMYAVYAQGVAVPMINLETGGILVNATVGNVTKLYAAGQWAAPALSVTAGSRPTATVLFTGPYFNVTETGRTNATNGASVTVAVLPRAGVAVHELQLALTAPSGSVALLHSAVSAGVVPRAGGLDWSMNASIGPLTGTTTLTTHITARPAPDQVAVSAAGRFDSAALRFLGASGRALSVNLTFATPGTGGNPAITLPTLLDTAAFLSAHDIHFLLTPRSAPYAYTVTYYERLFGWQLGYANAEWGVLTG